MRQAALALLLLLPACSRQAPQPGAAPDAGGVPAPFTATGTAADGRPVTISGSVTVGEAPAPVTGERNVSPTGSDTTGTGTAAKPFATPAKALAQAQAGDTITLAAGTYPGGLVVTKANVALRSAPGARAVLALPTTDAAREVVLKFAAPGGTVQNVEIVGGYYFGLKFDQGPGLVEGCQVRGPGVCGIKIVPGAHDVTIRGTEVSDTGKRTTANSQGIDCVRGDRLRVSDCSLHHVTDMAICVKGGSRGSVIERCKIEDCWIGVQLGQVTDWEWLDKATNPELFESIDGVVKNCLIRRSRYAGIALWASLRPQVLGNTVLDAAKDGQGALFFSTADRMQNGVLKPFGSRDAVVRGNVFTVPAVTTQPRAPVVQVQPHAIQGSLMLSHSRYWAGGNPLRFMDIRGYPEDLRMFEGDLAAWQARTSQETGSSSGDPRLGPDGRPLVGSPLLGAGVALSGLADDLAGVARGNGPSIGAYERVAPGRKR